MEIRCDSRRYLGCKSLNDSRELAPGEVFGNHTEKPGRTWGELKPEGLLEMFKEEADELLFSFGHGQMENVFDVVENFLEGFRIATVVLHGCRIKKVYDSDCQGTDALTTKFDLDVMWIGRNRILPLKNMLSWF